jgi:dolichyl-phosphate-mannose--protein O-mannosyl transferase
MPRVGPSWTKIAVPVIVLVLAAAIRLWGLGFPPGMIWDEQYYVLDASAYLGGGIGQPVGDPPAVKIADEGTWIHPPLGKWMMALLGIGPMGQRSIGWRLPSAVFGIAGVGLLYLLAFRLWRSEWWAGLASLLLALDGLHIVQSRVAALDIFLTTFMTAGLLFLTLDREQMDARSATSRWPRIERLFGSPYRLWSGIFLGAAVATKWSGAFALALAAVLCSVWLFTGDRRAGRSSLAAAGTLVVSFAVVPLGVYLLSYGSFFFQHGLAIQDFFTLQLRMLAYQRHHLGVQPENSQPWTWPLLLHPISYFRSSTASAINAIVALGNPALWWGFLVLLPVGLFTVARRPTWRDALIFGGYLSMFLPWLAIPRSEFFYYMLPAVPFMCLGVAAILRGLPRRAARAAGIAYAAIAGVVAIAYLPAWTGWSTSASWLNHLRVLPRWPL